MTAMGTPPRSYICQGLKYSEGSSHSASKMFWPSASKGRLSTNSSIRSVPSVHSQ